MPTAADSVLGSIPRAEAGIGSGTYGVAIQIGGALGVAVIGSALSTRYQNHITGALASRHVPEPVLHTITGSLGGALGVAGALGGVLGALLEHAARASFMSGVHLSLGLGALVAGAAALLALVALPSRARPEDEHADRLAQLDARHEPKSRPDEREHTRRRSKAMPAPPGKQGLRRR